MTPIFLRNTCIQNLYKPAAHFTMFISQHLPQDMSPQYKIRTVHATHLKLGFIVFHNIKFLAALSDIKSGAVFTSNKFVDYRNSVYVSVFVNNAKRAMKRKYNVVILNIKELMLRPVSDNTLVGTISAIITKFLSRGAPTGPRLLNKTDAIVYDLCCYDPLDHHHAYPKRVTAYLSNTKVFEYDDGRVPPILYFKEIYNKLDY